MTSGYVWHTAECDLRDRSTLALGEGSGFVNYAFTWVKSDSQRTVRLVARGDDQIKAWLNGSVINSGSPSFSKFVTLYPEANTLLVKVLNTAGKSSLQVVFQDNDRNTPLGIEYLLSRPTQVVEGVRQLQPAYFDLTENYPNAFNATTWISFELDQPGHVSLTIYDISGRRVQTLVEKHLEAGVDYRAWWNGKDSFERDVASGVYLYQLKTNGFSKTKKMMLVR